MQRKILIIGSGIAGLSAGACLAKQGHQVTVVEKNDQLGGRARKLQAEGFTFDMGPSWYWMPDVFENFFAKFGHSVQDYYELIRLNPSYRVFFGKNDLVDLPANLPALYRLFDSMETGSGDKLKYFLDEAAYKYKVGMGDMVFRPGQSIKEFLDLRLIKAAFKLHLFESVYRYIHRDFSNPKLTQILEFPVLFLGATSEKTPALYTMMNYADMALGTWYPKGGMYQIIEAMVKLCRSMGVAFHTNTCVESLAVENNHIIAANTSKDVIQADIVVAAGDYHAIEQKLLAPQYRNYTEKYWQSRTMAPSCLIYYLGIGKKIAGLLHHNLFFDQPFKQHAIEIYDKPQWPSKPLFYVSCTSKTDETAAPEGCENIFILIPVAAGLKDNTAIQTKYFDIVMKRLEYLIGEDIQKHIIYQKRFSHSDFIQDYHAFKGNAYGLANTLKQTAIFKPLLRSKKVKNLFFAGQLTVPGPGVPPAIISGQVVAKEIEKHENLIR